MTSSDYQQIIYSVDDRVATITLNRPEQLNAFTGTMMYEMIDAFDRIDADDDVRAVIVTGAGRGFCAGADLSGGGATFSRGGSDQGSDAQIDGHDVTRDGGGLLTLRIFECKKPVIAAVNGAAVGVGVTMTLPMDIRLASEGDRREHRPGQRRAHPSDAVADARRRPSHGGPSRRLPCDRLPRAQRGRPRR